MISGYDVDPKTLSWIKEEVNKTANDAQIALELFVEHPEDNAQIQLCADYLHRIRGALEIVEIFGAALLANQMEQVAIGLVHNKIELKKEAIDVLMCGLLQLPAYLEHLYHGHKDIPLVLLPLLNDLLAVQNKELQTESTFFFPNLTIYKPASNKKSFPTWKAETIAKKLRPAYLVGLLGLFRDIEVEKNLRKLATVVSNLEQVSGDKKVEQLFWVTSAVIQSLYDKGLESSVAVKLLLGKVDRQIKKLIDQGEEALSMEHPTELIQNLLYYIGCSNSRSSKVVELKNAFGLNFSHHDADVINEERKELIGFNANIMENVAEQIKEELLKIKDTLDITIYSKDGDVTELNPVIDRLRTVADALGMLGFIKMRKIVQQQESFIADLLKKGATRLKSDDVLHIAGALLYIESSLYDLNAGRNESFDTDDIDLSSTTTIPLAEYRQLVKIVVHDAVKELAKVKDVLIEFALDGSRFEALEKIPPILNSIKGALEILNYYSLAGIVQSIKDYVEIELLLNKTSPDGSTLDLIADAVTGVEYFLEGILERSVAPEAALAAAEASLAKLGRTPKKPTLEQKIKSAEENFDEIVINQTIPAVHGGDLVDESETEVDSELMAIFLAEAGDEIEAISNNLEVWKLNHEDQNSLNSLIRSFHTLKGAGRIVGATSVGVLSWSIEELLRRVMSDRVQPSNEIVELLEQTLPTLKQIVDHMKNGNKDVTSAEVQELIDMSRELRESKQVVG